MKSTLRITREWAMPSSNTFTILPIRCFVEPEVRKGGFIVDPFANTCKYGTITNDLNPEYPTDYHMDALKFVKQLDTACADLVLYDPPYSVTQASQCYKSYGKEKLDINISNSLYWSKLKDEIARITKIDGRVICCGWDTNGIGINRGFQMTDILLVCHGGIHHDTIVTLEKKLYSTKNYKLFDIE
jgi:hypothetical protein